MWFNVSRKWLGERKHPGARPPSRRRTVRPRLEGLEGRSLPSTVNWINPLGGNFNVASNWKDATTQQNHVPGPGDDAVINFDHITVTVSDSEAVNTLSTSGNDSRLSISTGTLTLTNSVNSGHTTGINTFLDLQSGGTLIVSGNNANPTASLFGSGAIAGTINVSAGTQLNFSIYSVINTATYTVSSGAKFEGDGLYQLSTASNTAFSDLVLNTDVEVSHFGLGLDGNLKGAGKLTVLSQLDWTAGSMSEAGSTDIAAGAVLNISGTDTKTLDSRTINNYGTTNWTGAAKINGANDHNNTPTFNNEKGAAFNVSSDQQLMGVIFHNAGTFTKTSAQNGATDFLDSPLDNDPGGLVRVVSGTLFLGGGGTSQSSFQVRDGANLIFSTDFIYGFSTTYYTLDAGTTFQGAGQYQLYSSNGPYGTAYLTLNTDVFVEHFILGSGGDLQGARTLSAVRQMDWTGGTMSGTGSTDIAAGAVLNISGTNDKTLDSRTVNNDGTTTWTGTGNILGKNSQSTPTFNNQASGLFEVDNSQSLRYAVFNNDGVVLSTGYANLGYAGTFNNTGTVEARSGFVYLGDNGTAAGTFIADAGAGVNFTVIGTYTLNDGASLSGAGTFYFGDPNGTYTNGNTLINGNVTVTADLVLINGTLGGSGSLTVSGANFDWQGGTIANLAGGLEIATGATLTIDGNGNKTLNGHTIAIDGAATWKDNGGITFSGSNPTINVLGNGSFTIQNDQGITGSGGYFSNAGTLTKVNGGGTQTTFGPNIQFTNSGRLNVASGKLEIDNFGQTGGLTTVTGTLASTKTVAINAGELAGTGIVQANVSADTYGTVSPAGDGAVGELTIEGNYTQYALGVLNIDVAGAVTQGVDYDWLNVTGTATLGGTLNVNFLYAPVVGDNYRVLTAKTVTSGSSFAQVNAIHLDSSLQLAVAYDPSDMTLSVVSSSGPEVALSNRPTDDRLPLPVAVAPVHAVNLPAVEWAVQPAVAASVHPADAYFLLAGGGNAPFLASEANGLVI